MVKCNYIIDEYIGWRSGAVTLFVPTQALPYVALLIAMLFFIYAVIGMQVTQFLTVRIETPT